MTNATARSRHERTQRAARRTAAAIASLNAAGFYLTGYNGTDRATGLVSAEYSNTDEGARRWLRSDGIVIED